MSDVGDVKTWTCPVCEAANQLILASRISQGRVQAVAVSLCGCDLNGHVPGEWGNATPHPTLVEAARRVSRGDPVHLQGLDGPVDSPDELFREWGDFTQPAALSDPGDPHAGSEAEEDTSSNREDERRDHRTPIDHPVQLSVIKNSKPTVRNPEALLTKTFRRSDSGGIERGVATEMVEGELRVEELARPQQLADLIQGLSPQEALMFGVPKGGTRTTPVVSKRRVQEGTPGITRTNEDIEFPERGGLLYLDFDHLGSETSELRDALEKLVDVVPALGRAPTVLVPSASSLIRDTSTDEAITGLRGVHGYVWLRKASEAPAIAARLRNRLILNGQGYCFVSRAGRPFVRVPFDQHVFQPVRLAYAAGAVCELPLTQERGKPRALNEGGPPLALEDVPELSEEEQARVKEIEQELIEKSRGEIEAKRATYREARIKDGVDPEALDGMLEYGALEGEFPIQFADGTTATVQEIRADPDRYVGRECYDAEEPGYQGGKVVGKLLRDDRGTMRIHSFAHGGRVYILARTQEEAYEEAAEEFTADLGQGLLRRFSEIQSVPIDWLLHGRLARREITMINGWPGEGKTSVVIDIVAKLSRGQGLPDGTKPPEPLKALVLSREDSASVLRLRLQAAGADLERVLTMEESVLGPMRLPSGEARWVEILRDNKIDVVVIDPMMAFLDDDLKSIAEQDARKFMEALHRVVKRAGAAAICIRHPNKATAGGSMNAISASSGSLAFTAAARIEFLVGRKPNSETVRALAAVKNNLARLPVVLLYEISSSAIEFWEGVSQDVAAVEWVGIDRSLTAEDLLLRRSNREERSRLSEATAFLEEHLGQGPLPLDVVLREAKTAAIAKRTLERAHQEIGWGKWARVQEGRVWVWGLNRHSVEDYRPDGATVQGPSTEESSDEAQGTHELKEAELERVLKELV